MTFHTDLVADAVLPTDIRTTLGLTAAGSVYPGRRPKQTTSTDLEVWIERQPAVPRTTAPPGLEVYVYDLHIRGQRGTQGSNKAGAAHLVDVDAALDALKTRYDAKARFATALTGLVAISAEEINVDVDPSDEKVQEAVLRLSFVVET